MLVDTAAPVYTGLDTDVTTTTVDRLVAGDYVFRVTRGVMDVKIDQPFYTTAVRIRRVDIDHVPGLGTNYRLVLDDNVTTMSTWANPGRPVDSIIIPNV